MPGVPGRSGGHNRKRSDQKLGHAKTARTDPQHPDNADRPRAIGKATQPELVKCWPEEAPVPLGPVQNLWNAMATSGFDEYFTDADWQGAAIQLLNLHYIVVEMMEKGSLSALKSAEMRSIMADLLVLESARRRLRIEVQRADPDAERPVASVSHLDLARGLA